MLLYQNNNIHIKPLKQQRIQKQRQYQQQQQQQQKVNGCLLK